MSTFRRCHILALIGLVIAGLLCTRVVYANGQEAVNPDKWMEGYTLFLTDAENVGEAYMAADAVREEGGQVALIFPNKIMLGWVPSDRAGKLVGTSKIRSVHQKPFTTSPELILSKDEQSAVTFFNSIVSGKYKAKKQYARAWQAAGGYAPIMMPDRREPQTPSYNDFINNIVAQGITEEMLKDAGIAVSEGQSGELELNPGNSDAMVGKIVYNVIFVESNGGSDPNLYSWNATAADVANMNAVKSEISAGLSWWTSTGAGSKYSVPITWMIKYNYSSKTTTMYEPILHSSGSDSLWINEIMGKFGYAAGDKWARTAAFNSAQRITSMANWAVVNFIAYNPSPAPTTFTDGYFAYWWGSYEQMLWRNDGWATTDIDLIVSHETGHAFGAWDEYYQAGYGGCGATDCTTHGSNGVFNGNCERCQSSPVNCMMRGNTHALCGYTPGQIGWPGIYSLKVTPRSQAGVNKVYFAPGEKIQFHWTWCADGPDVAADAYPLWLRGTVEYFGGTSDAPTVVTYNPLWSWGDVGTGCWYWDANTNVPANATFGPATIRTQANVYGLGKGAMYNSTPRFFILPSGANPTETSPLASPAEVLTETPYERPQRAE